MSELLMKETSLQRVMRSSGRVPIECKCNQCKNQCKTVCLGTPEDIEKIIDAGYADRLALTQWADVCVMILPCGRSANTEAGWMKGAGKRVMVYYPKKEEPELMYKIYDFVSDSIFRINDEIIRV